MRAAAALAVMLLGVAAPLAGQGRGGQGADRVPKAPRKLLTAADSAKAKRDSLKNQPLATWEPADSVGEALMRKDGYHLVRYKADTVEFAAKSHVITLRSSEKERSAVQREPSTLVAKVIEFHDSTSDVYATGDKIVLRDPSRNDDLAAEKELTYNFKAQVGKMRDFTTSTKSGETWYVAGHVGGFVGDSTDAKQNAVYGVDGTITSCDDSILHYHFAVKEFKRITNNTMVARSAVMYIQDVPVFWFPFIFQDARQGRRSGILTPRFGFAELLRNSPTYRRNIENLGYYFALSDYYDASVAMDWRSSANATAFDPGWTRLNGEVRYQWRDRFLSGRLAVSQQSLSTGNGNTSISWAHQQDFSIRSKLTVNFNYVTSTTVQRQTALTTNAAVATIASQANFQQDFGTVQLQVGGSQRQYPGRPQIDLDFPSINLTSKPIEVNKWLLWTPTFQFASSQSVHMDSQGDFATAFVARPDATLDSVKVDKSTRTSNLTFNSPIKIGDFTINTGVKMQDRENDFPELRVIVDPTDTSKKSNRIYKRTYLTSMDFIFDVALPNLRLKGFGLDKWNLVPTIAMANVDGGPEFVRSERTGSAWVSQGKRFSYGMSASPTFFGLFNIGIGPVEKIRHSINPKFDWSYSPAAAVSNDYLAAL
ncbi:MAG: LPS-assembly protein LptD, partial [Gemmatimonadetes bacterium]|nr:LPS-assembly protein LptD [Gemmatimonadota bacterium]